MRSRLAKTPVVRAITAPLKEVQASARTDGRGNIVNINKKPATKVYP
jgi:hypothetical protein